MTPAERLEALLSDPEKMHQISADFTRMWEIEDKQLSRVRARIESIPEDQLEAEFLKFLKWEETWEEDQYVRNHCMTCSHAFGYMLTVLEEKGSRLKKVREDFYSGGFKWNGYTFKMYCGQGCFWRILKGKKQIFQTT